MNLIRAADRYIIMLTIREYTAQSKDVWSNFVARCPDSNIGHRIEWKEVMEESFGRRTRYLLALDGDEIRGILPLVMVRTFWGAKALVSMPWIDYGGVCAIDDAGTGMLLQKAREIAEQEKAGFIELRSVQARDKNLADRHDKVTFLLDTNRSPETIWKEFNAKLRNQIRKAHKSGLSTEFTGVEGLDRFYKVFCRNMRDLGTPVWGRNCFEKVLTAFGKDARLILVAKGSKTIAGGVVLSFKDRVYVPWASAIRDWIKYCPNHALYWAVIKDTSEKGYDYFDFGRSTIDSNTFRFKKHWVPVPQQLNWQYYLRTAKDIPSISPDNPAFKIFVKLWQRLPLPIANYFGPKVNKMLP
ncbi:MAG TPA: FemAB family PEP-CTERM system-associated protein [candidate division Zixibacteria bacterium]|nr:FemAB family PEP-CTERM system-associated protein [candidate division Zixibacteria bacterium]HEQ98427.1 FemAB family PEP-CTERM system-associated protein [candidate division Zixibacteria bacterium]